MTAKQTVRVERQRWEIAQDWEKQHWKTVQEMRDRYGKNLIWKLIGPTSKSKYRGDDWNYWWQERFEQYDFLPRRLENAIELGCGPYTNLRLIVDRCNIKHIFLSDPLIRDYARFKLTFVSEMYKDARCILDDHPIEETPFKQNYFDLVIMINVLDHVQDAELCITNAINIVKPDGILIIGQDLTNDVDMSHPGVRDDIGHPIKVGHDWLDEFVDSQFHRILHRILPREAGRNPEAHYGTYIFAGKKLSQLTAESST